MKKRDFSEWLSTFRRSINGYEYYTDFKKCMKMPRGGNVGFAYGIIL